MNEEDTLMKPSGLEELLAKLDPKTRKRFQTASNVSKEFLPTASLELNEALGGGFPRSQISTIFGNYSSSKTAMTLETIGRLQKTGLTCAFVDAEGTYDKEWATRLGVDNDSLILVRKKSFGAITDEIVPLLEVGLDFIAIDSITSALPEVFVDDGALKEFDNRKQIGAHARSCGMMINGLHYVNKRTAIVLISQTRTDMSGMHPMQKPSGGKVVEFGSSCIVKLTSSASEKEQIKGDIVIGDKIHTLPIGRKVEISVVKNKVGPPNRVGQYNFYYGGPNVGIDNIDELVTLGKKYGTIRAAGAWVYFDQEGLQWNGQQALVKDLRTNPGLVKRIEADYHMKVTGEIIE